MPSLTQTLLATMASSAAIVAAETTRQVTTVFMPDMDLAGYKLTLSPVTVQSGGVATEYSIACGSYGYDYVVQLGCGAARAYDLTYTLGPSTAHLVQSGSSVSREFDCTVNPTASSAKCAVTHAELTRELVNGYDDINFITLDDAAYDRYMSTHRYSYTTSTSTGVRTVTMTGTRYENAIHTAIVVQDSNKPVITDTAAPAAATTTSPPGSDSQDKADPPSSANKPGSATGVSLSLGAVAMGALLSVVMAL